MIINRLFGFVYKIKYLNSIGFTKNITRAMTKNIALLALLAIFVLSIVMKFWILIFLLFDFLIALEVAYFYFRPRYVRKVQYTQKAVLNERGGGEKILL